MRASADQVATRYPENGFGGPVDKDVAPIPSILDDNRHGHVLDDVIEEFLGTTERCSGCIESFQLPEMNERDRQTRERQCNEESQSDADALPRYGMEKGRDRNVDRERTHKFVEMPLRLVRLQSVMTVNATHFLRETRIDRAEHQFPIDVEQL